MRTLKFAATALAALLMFIVVIAAATGAQDVKPAAKPKEQVSIDGDKWKWHGEGDTSVYTIMGHVVIKQGDTVVTSDTAEYNEKTKIAVVEGNVKVVDGPNQITGAKATAFLNDRKCVVDGSVKMLAQPKQNEPAPKTTSVAAKLKEPTQLFCDRLEYLYRKKIATAEGNLKILQKGRSLVGSKAVYDVNGELVTLAGGVQVNDDRGQSFTSPGEVRVSLKEGSEWIEAGSGSARLNVQVDEEGEPEKAPEKAGQ